MFATKRPLALLASRFGAIGKIHTSVPAGADVSPTMQAAQAVAAAGSSSRSLNAVASESASFPQVSSAFVGNMVVAPPAPAVNEHAAAVEIEFIPVEIDCE
ncbi:hypothetical protein H9P43_001329 [Blastocladiella emersonii ATCC 22665]|nr:hypothetical protein H9P43_001329 [Blastocladiella emersonii ATCC 22665]